MSSFKEFLKEYRWDLADKTVDSQSIKDYEEGKVISVRALGEWALDKAEWYTKQAYNIEKEYKSLTKYDLYSMPGGINELISRAATYGKIAIGCLGEKEVKKRLEELK